jgi:cytoskeletal protein CcmA (bactofilin family)
MALFGRDEKDLKVERPPSTFEPRAQPAAPMPLREPVREPVKEPPMVERAQEKADGGEVGAEVNAYLGRGSRVSGKLNFEGTVRVDGQVEGEISAQDTLIVGERAVVTAQITGTTIVIKGKVTGDINARKRVEIRAPGKLYGNIVTPSLVIHDGVIFEGHCSMGGDLRAADSKSTPTSKEEKGADGVLSRMPSEATK